MKFSFRYCFLNISWFFCSVISCLFAADEQDLAHINIDTYLKQNGYFLSPSSSTNEGFSSIAQREAFLKDILKSPQIKTIAEIGLNGGHSCESFLNASNEINLTSFDLNVHPYTRIALEFLKRKYLDRFDFIEGDSTTTLKNYATSFNKKFDLIFIDGCHKFKHVIHDIYLCSKLAHRGTEVWIDDYNALEVQKAVNSCERKGIIKIIEIRNVEDEAGVRIWAKARYTHFQQAEAYFTSAYETGLWGKDASGRGTSGAGSIVQEALPFIQYIQNFLDTHQIQSIVDVGCGDWVLAREIQWGDSEYLGIDIVENLIRDNQKIYGSDKVRFLKQDVGITPMPAGDLLICKDVFIHLPDSEVDFILKESKKFKFCIFVNDINSSDKTNVPFNHFGVRCVHLTCHPFLIKPIERMIYTSSGTLKELILMQN
jgi:predicted O-methyltransferase YrrM/SAM-dependent methyltransferase